jgi:ATP-dependent DNA helicase RecQ
VRLTGRGSPRMAQQAIRAARDRGWEAYRSIEQFSSGALKCRRRQILDHFGDDERGAPTGRCCDVCDRDDGLEGVLLAEPAASPRRRGARGPSRGADGQRADPVEEGEFEQLRAWRWERAEGKPAYTVAANAVLEELLRRRPRDVAELLEVRGIGPAFCEKHGSSLLQALRSLAETASAGAAPAGQGAPREQEPALASEAAPT